MVEYSLIYAPTQVGKTEKVIQYVKENLKEKRLVVYSTDNKGDQMNQFLHRINYKENENQILVISHITDNKLKKLLKYNITNELPTIIVVMDNYSQLSKLRERIVLLQQEGVVFPPTTIFHDEGDVITKSNEIQNVLTKQPKSHQEWLLLSDFLIHHNISTRRIFVSATPENIVFLYKIYNIISIPIPSTYQGYEHFIYKPIENNKLSEIIQTDIEVKRFRGENGIILLNVDRITEGIKKKDCYIGQDVIMNDLYKHFHSYNIVISIYNGKGITLYIPPNYKTEFCQYINNYNKMQKKNERIRFDTINNTQQYLLTNCPIGWFYQFCKDCGIDIVITIGCDLMNRGISYCSIKKETNALTATTMIYRPSLHRHGVGLVQTIGRLSGTCRPDLQRTLYTSSEIIEKYKKMCENQTDFINNLERELSLNDTMDSKQFFKNFELKHKIKGPIDRPKLNLDFKFKKTKPVHDKNTIDGVKLGKLKDICNKNNSVISKMIRFLMDFDEPIELEQLKNGIDYTKNSKSFISSIENGCGCKSQYGMLWISKKNHKEIIINPKIKKYILQNNL